MAIKERNKTKMLILVILIIVLSSLSGQPAFCAWSGPIEVLSGIWGSDIGQFGLVRGDTGDGFPKEFGIDKDLMVVIADEMNGRVQLFDRSGNLNKVINKPAEIKATMWPGSLIVLYEGNSFLANLYVYNYSGQILSKINIPRTERYRVLGGYIIRNLDNNVYSYYSPTGELVRTSAERPLELGEVKEKYLGPGRYKVTVKYPDKTWEITGEGACPKYVRDISGNLYCVGDVGVVRYDSEGRVVANVMVPENKIQSTPSKVPGAEPTISIIEQYGQPVVAPNGDVYTWKRTPNKYSIIKWTWQ